MCSQTMLNNSAEPVFPGDMLEYATRILSSRSTQHTHVFLSPCRRWTLTSEKPGTMAKRTKTGPRRVGIQVASPTSERVIGRCAAPPSQPLRLTLCMLSLSCLLCCVFRCLTFAKPVRYDPLAPFSPFCLCSRLPLCVPAQMETFDLLLKSC